jgi:inosine/xanthosine triphosphatase
MAFPYAHIVVGSTNPVKVAAVRAVYARVLTGWPGAPAPEFLVFDSVSVDSGVPAQPMGDEETQQGARNRALAALERTSADLAVGLEGGVVLMGDGRMRTCAWAVVRDRSGREGMGGSLSMPLPETVAARIHAGEELGYAMDAVAQVVGTKHGRGAVGILTAGLIDRQAAYEPMIAYALAPWLAPAFYEAPPVSAVGTPARADRSGE